MYTLVLYVSGKRVRWLGTFYTTRESAERWAATLQPFYSGYELRVAQA